MSERSFVRTVVTPLEFFPIGSSPMSVCPVFLSTRVRIAPLLSFQIIVSHSQCPISSILFHPVSRFPISGYFLVLSPIIIRSAIWYFHQRASSFLRSLYFLFLLLICSLSSFGVKWVYIHSYTVSFESFTEIWSSSFCFFFQLSAICSGDQSRENFSWIYLARFHHGSILLCDCVVWLLVLKRSIITVSAMKFSRGYFLKRRENHSNLQ
jgi:hypothetical protein